MSLSHHDVNHISAQRPYRLSVLDKSPILPNETATNALQRTLALAKQADALGYHRFWIAEHHNTSQLASPSPEILIAWIIAQTQRIRVGSGGVMLQHYSPYKVAENFNLLASLAPHRIDLGVGKAPGGLPLATKALQHAINPQEKGDFDTQLAQLDKWLGNAANPIHIHTNTDSTVAEPAVAKVEATPIPEYSADRFLLGASEESALLAAKLGWNFVFAAHLNGDKSLLEKVLRTWQQNSPLPTIVAVQIIVSESEAHAKALAEQIEIWGVELENGQRVAVPSEAAAHQFVAQAGVPARSIAKRASPVISGTAESVHATLADLQRTYKIDEFIVDIPINDETTRLSTLKLLSEDVEVKSASLIA